MDYYLIKGHFHVIGYSPEGDSLMFQAGNPKVWDKIASEHRAIFERKQQEGEGVVQLRLQGIDSLETHYAPSPLPRPKEVPREKSPKAEKPVFRKLRQPAAYGDLATHTLLEQFDVDLNSIQWRRSGWGGRYISELTVQRGTKNSVHKKKHTDALEGYVVVNDMDRKGRPIAWVFAGRTHIRNGSRLTTSALEKILKKSCNYKLVSVGLVYPYFFFTLEAALRDVLMYAVKNAQRQKMNIWSEDESSKGIPAGSISEVTERHLIFPYLFRRLVKHRYRRMMEGYWSALQSDRAYQPDPNDLFLESFFEDSNPYVFLIEEREFKRLDEIVKISRTRIRLTTHPGNIVFLS
jgi:hypothetical protein